VQLFFPAVLDDQRVDRCDCSCFIPSYRSRGWSRLLRWRQHGLLCVETCALFSHHFVRLSASIASAIDQQLLFQC